MNKILSLFLLSALFFLGGCALSSKNTAKTPNTPVQNSSASANTSSVNTPVSTAAATFDETDETAVELGHGYAVSLPSGWKVTDRQENTENLFVPSAGPEITTTIQQILREDSFDPGVVFNTFTVDAALSAQEVAQLADISCKKQNFFEEFNINTIPAYVLTAGSDFCEDGTGITFQKYYTLKKEGNPETLIAIFYTESEAEYNQLKDDFDAILDSLTLQGI